MTDRPRPSARRPGRAAAPAALRGAPPRSLGLPLALTLVIAAMAAGGGCRRTPPPSLPSSLFGATMPAFDRPAIDGRRISSTALRGDVVVVEFFASYCEPCRRSLPALRKLAARDPSLRVVAIGEDEREGATRAMAAEYELGVPVIHDAGNVLAARFRIDGLPSTFVIDGEGAVRWIGGADHDAATLARVVAAIRSERER